MSSLYSNIENQANASNREDYNFGEDVLTLTSKRANKLDENVLKLRKTLYTGISKTLKSLITSPADLSKFRAEMSMLVDSELQISLETFAENMFSFFNQHFFFNILDSVKINWSKRFKT